MKGFAVVLVLLTGSLAGCAGGTALDYSARAGKPMVSVVTQKMSVAQFSPEAAKCPACVGGDASAMVTVPMQVFTPAPFPASGREVPCTVTSVPGSYRGVAEAAAAPPRTFVWTTDAVVWLRACREDAADYALTVTVTDTCLPVQLHSGDRVTLRFLADGRFFDVKEWSAAGQASRMQLLPRG